MKESDIEIQIYEAQYSYHDTQSDEGITTAFITAKSGQYDDSFQ